ncbi:MAG: hypothetical protein ACE367_24625 [Acidimicrobiales bacterium]
MPNTKQLASLEVSSLEVSGLLMLCAGKDCARKESGAFEDLVTRAGAGGCTVEYVKCQGSCTGPTAVVHDGARLRWFERLDKPGVRRDLVAFAAGTAVEIPKRLAKRELTGRSRDKAHRRLAAQKRRR